MQNFRCFENHTVLFDTTVIAVGKNNAGKSSLIEALRLVAAVVNRQVAQFVLAPKWLDLPRFRKGIAPGIEQLGIDLNTVFHRYGSPPAIITATFRGGASVTIYVGREETIFATIEAESQWIETAFKFRQLEIPWINVLPQIGPLLTEEYRINVDRVTKNLNSRLSSRHFRNQLLRMDEAFAAFRTLAEETWHGLSLEPVQEQVTDEGTLLSLPVRDGDFVAEVGWMGHGLQMWLQTIWFLSKTPAESTVVLDEPDVYMHPDLQRKLFRLTQGRFRQCLIATHSVEIMAEAEPDNILIIDKKQRRSRYANTEPGVQALIDQIGGIHNVHLARLWSAKKFLLVEGKDVALLKHFHAILFPDADLPLDALPSLPIGGWSGWPYAIGSSMTLKNAVGELVATYCVLDSDYHSEEEIRKRYEEAESRGVYLHVWKRKEIENFLLQPRAIRKMLTLRIKGKEIPSVEEIRLKILAICEGERHSTEDGFASAIMAADRRLDVSTANKMARAHVEANWHPEEGRVAVTSGKTVLSELSKWSQEHFGMAFGPPAVARHMSQAELPSEVVEVLRAVETGQPFPALGNRNRTG